MQAPHTIILNKMEAQRIRLQSQIDWAKFALTAPHQYINEALQELRKERLISMLKEMAELTKLIEAEKFKILEEKTLADRQEVKVILAALGTRFEDKGRVFYLLP